MALIQQRIRVEGFADSQVHLKIAVLQLNTGQVHLAIEGVEPTIQNLVDIRQLLDQVTKKIDDQLPQLVSQGVKELTRG
jgi:hypothetical protein